MTVLREDIPANQPADLPAIPPAAPHVPIHVPTASNYRPQVKEAKLSDRPDG